MMSTIENTQVKAKDAIHDVASSAASTSKDWYSRAERLVQMAIRLAPLVPGRALFAGLERVGLRRRSTTRFEAAASFTAGLFVGSAVTALVTPWSGAELRGKIASGFVRAEKSAEVEAEKATNAIKQAETSAIEGVRDLVSNTKTSIAEGRDALADAIRDPKHADGHHPVRVSPRG